jgi:hypothetical protein
MREVAGSTPGLDFHISLFANTDLAAVSSLFTVTVTQQKYQNLHYRGLCTIHCTNVKSGDFQKRMVHFYSVR